MKLDGNSADDGVLRTTMRSKGSVAIGYISPWLSSPLLIVIGH